MPAATKKLHTPKLTQEQMFEAAHHHAMNSPANEFVRIAIPNLLAVTLVGANARVSLGFAERKRAEAEKALSDSKAHVAALEKELESAYKGASEFAETAAKYKEA